MLPLARFATPSRGTRFAVPRSQRTGKCRPRVPPFARAAFTGGSRVPPSRRGHVAACPRSGRGWPTSVNISRPAASRPRQPIAHTIGPACERRPPGHDPAGAAFVPPFARVAFTGGSRIPVANGSASRRGPTWATTAAIRQVRPT